MGDPAQLGQAVANLVLNAMQALAGQGTVRVHTARAVLGDGESAVLAAGGRVVTLEVIDDGVGMDPEALAHAFEPFFSGKAATSIRRGLGLAMVYGALRDHQGEVQLRSVPGQGTTATLRLPEAEPQPAQAQRAPAQAPGDGLFGAVLVIDDERLVRAAVRRLLRSQGVECVEAASGAEALEHFRPRPHAFALVVLDLSMPEMSGAECFAHLRRIDATVPILVASGYPKDQHVETLLAAGPAEFLAKPFAREEFLMAAVQCCSRAPRRPGLRAAEAAPT
jgi:CheY-like chemotaxis protein